MISPDEKGKAQNSQIENLLAAHADAIDAELMDFKKQFANFGLAPSQTAEAADLLDLAQTLRSALAPIEPSLDFTRRLKSELVGEPPLTLLVRWRKLPAHYQLAAKLGGLTITAGLVLLAVRRALAVLNALHRRDDSESDKGLSLHTVS
jgi:hypothetical protein